MPQSSTNPHADLIAKLDEEILRETLRSDVKALDNPKYLKLLITRDYVARGCPDCDGSGTLPYHPVLDAIFELQPCPNPRHALIGELRRVMGL